MGGGLRALPLPFALIAIYRNRPVISWASGGAMLHRFLVWFSPERCGQLRRGGIVALVLVLAWGVAKLGVVLDPWGKIRRCHCAQ